MGWDGNIRVAVFGAGSIGCYVGGYLASTGTNVSFIGRDKTGQALKEHGLTLTHYEREPVHLTPGSIQYHLQPRHIADANIILVTVKSQDTDEAARAIAWHARKDAIIVSLQNGVGNSDALRAHLPDHTVLGGMVPFNVTSTGPGAYHSGTEGALVIEASSDPRIGQLMDAFAASGLPAETHENIQGVLWGKLLINLNNALNVLHGDNLMTGLVQRDYRRALADSIEEGLKICQSAGINPISFGRTTPEKAIKTLRLPNMLYKPIMQKMIKIDAAARSSMLDDLELGRASEIDYLQGAIVRLAQDSGQSAPINAAILAATEAAFAAGKSPKYTGTQIYNLTR